jgi:hypothetical protein
MPESSNEKPTGVHRIWRMIAIGLILGIAARAVFTRASAKPIDPPPLSVRGDSLPAADPRLKTNLDHVDFDHVKLADALKSLVDRSGMNLVVGWDAMDKAGISRDAMVSVNLKNVALSAALDAVLFTVDPKHQSCWNVQAGVIEVTSVDAPNTQHLFVRLYDVERLIKHGESTPVLDDARMDELKKCITDNVATTTWKDNGGDIGSISSSPVSGTMVIIQTAQAHEQIESLLRVGAEIEVSSFLAAARRAELMAGKDRTHENEKDPIGGHRVVRRQRGVCRRGVSACIASN